MKLSSPHFSPIIRFAAGFLLATAFIWFAGALFRTSPSLYQKNESLGLAHLKPSSFKQERTENWVTKQYGALGLSTSDAEKLNSGKPVVAIFGDSFVEASMIPDTATMQNFIDTCRFSGIGIGYSGAGASEYACMMRRYQKLIPNLAVNVVFIGDYHGDLDAIGSEPGCLPLQNSSRLDEISSKLRLYAFRGIIRNARRRHLITAEKQKESVINTQSPEFTEKKVSVKQIVAYWKEASGPIPLVIVFAPGTPRIGQNKIVLEDVQEQKLRKELADACRELHIELVDLTEEFKQYYFEKHLFVHGFFNTPPGEGHLNEAGHRIAGEAINRCLQENF